MFGSVSYERTRIERDSMGDVEVPADAYYGASTLRAAHNFPISPLRFPRPFVRALGLIKKAAAEVNDELGLVDSEKARAIARAAAEVAEGKLDDQFILDVFQTGSGTSTNTNANEVIANRASELLGGPLGMGRLVHPNDDVNRCQSSNDVMPTAIHLSAAVTIAETLIPALEGLENALGTKSAEFMSVIKTGRTHLQDATPVRMGQEFEGYVGQVAESLRRARWAIEEVGPVALGGTAVGTGVNAHPEFASRVCHKLAEWTGAPIRETGNHFHAQAALDAVVAAHGQLRTIAVSLWKIGSDIRLMGTGPRAGLGELALPETQPGSSIMPGKVNPVIVESLTMVVARVMGNDTSVAVCGQSGSLLELNVMQPLAAHCVLESISLLAHGAQNLAERCVAGLAATAAGPEGVERGLMLVTALAPVIGYDEAAKLAKEAGRTGRTIRELARERGIPEDELTRILDPARMTEPGLGAGPASG